MSLKLKICGITNLEDARFCAGAGADYLGFIQHEDSPRYVRPQQVAKIGEWIHGPKPVGVFVNTPPDEVNRIVRVIHDASAEQLRQAMLPYRDHVEYFLLDTHATNLWGGTGESFNWRLARDLSSEFPLFLAGGISAGNVEEAVQTMRPLGVDLSSSLESAPGEKDFEKMERFFEVFDGLKERQTADG
ncbi:MAG: N-(5'-phosphoribosyl)anthranilate isomerase [Bacteroidetes bacterium QS_1_65_9]|nr:MAG: N-(5'-phosphoribosyl)anthranilate isomerase [Bacteroidetes bacterium QS_1_65_9]